MKNILFVHPGQFGIQTSTYYYCLLLKDKYKITYIGFNEGLEKKDIKGIKYINLARSQNGLMNRVLLFKTTYLELKNMKYDFILINYFTLCSFFSLISKDKTVIEIRSGFIFHNFIKKLVYNSILRIEVKLFKHITTISVGIVNYLNLPKRTHILPLGGLSLPIYNKKFDALKILYVGTFHERDISNTIFAYAKFFEEYGNTIKTHYTIIGFGSNDEIERIRALINTLKMNDHIFYKGVIRYPELNEYLKSHNIGMSYIPIRDHFDDQPPTKTFEYLLSGMAVLATATTENKKVINELNGFIIGDSVEDVYNGLKTIYSKRFTYCSENIQKDSQKYSWDNIVKENLIPYIEGF